MRGDFPERCAEPPPGLPRTRLICPLPSASRDRTPTSAIDGSYQDPALLNGQQKSLRLWEQAEQQASRGIQTLTRLGQGSRGYCLLIPCAPLTASLLTPRHRQRRTLQRREGPVAPLELRVPAGSRSLSLSLPSCSSLTSDPLWATWDLSSFSAPLAGSQQESSFEVLFQGGLQSGNTIPERLLPLSALPLPSPPLHQATDT